MSEVHRALGVREPSSLCRRLTARRTSTRSSALAFYAFRRPRAGGGGAPDGTCADLATVAEAAGVRDRNLLGALDMDDSRLRVLFATAAVFCFPSLEESFGMPPLEAMASGTPVVVSTSQRSRRSAAMPPSTPTRPIPPLAGAIDALMADPVARRAS